MCVKFILFMKYFWKINWKVWSYNEDSTHVLWEILRKIHKNFKFKSFQTRTGDIFHQLSLLIQIKDEKQHFLSKIDSIYFSNRRLYEPFHRQISLKIYFIHYTT